MQEDKMYDGRIKEWWKPKAGFLLAILFFAAFLVKTPWISFLEIFALSIITLSAIGIFGHLLNDIGDIEVDKLAGKPNRLTNKSNIQRFLLFLIVGIVALIPWFFLPSTTFSFILLGLEFFLLLIYAFPPTRLKNHAHIAVWIDAFYAYSLPSVLAFYTYSLAFSIELAWWNYSILFVWASSIGIRHILYHHVSDAQNDLLSGVPNLSNIYGPLKLNQIIRSYLLWIELALGVSFFILLWPILGGKSLVFVTLLVLLFFNWERVSFFKSFPNHQLSYLTADIFYTKLWLGIGIISCGLFQPLYFLFLIPFFPIFLHLKGRRLFSLLKKKWRKVVTLLSRAVNYGIYYFRKFFLRWSEERNRGEYYLDWKENKLKSKRAHIAILNSNLNKYTETFVGGHNTKLPFNIEYYYGKDLGVHAKEGNIDLQDHELGKVFQFFRKLFGITPSKLLANHLQDKKVQLMLCEFGPNGSLAAPISAMTGIPLICIFYGYDAWHKNTLEEQKLGYQQLFKTASSIVGVSMDICSQLEKLGCPKEKIKYLPCYVNLDLFTKKKAQITEPIFLSIGRFTETKSPHLTILAFKEVLKEIPNARLRIIGKDGGGELFEACHILVKALKIEDSVCFLGVKTPIEVKQEMDKASVFVQHSLTTPIFHDKEGTPVAIMEAMACGLPIVATKHAGIQELIEDGTSGLLVEEYDYLGMAKSMIKLYKDVSLREKFSKNAMNSIQNDDLICNHIEHLTALIQNEIK